MFISTQDLAKIYNDDSVLIDAEFILFNDDSVFGYAILVLFYAFVCYHVVCVYASLVVFNVSGVGINVFSM